MVGAGHWGKAYIRTIADLEDARLAAIFVRTPRELPGIPADCRLIDFEPQQLDDLDGLIIATPPESHAAFARAAIERRLPLLIEKPLTLDLDEARQLMSQAEASNASVMVEHTHLFHPAYRALQNRITDRGGTSIIGAIHASAGNRGPYRRSPSVLWDWGAHDIAMVLHLMGVMPRLVEAVLNVDRRIEDGLGQSLVVRLSYSSGVAAEMQLSNLLDERVRKFTVSCREEILVYDDCAEHKLTRAPVGAALATPISAEARLPLTQALIDFVALIESGDPDRRGLALGVSVVEILAACQRSIEERRSIELG